MKKGILHRPYTKKEIEDTLRKIEFEEPYKEVTGNCFSFIARKPQNVETDLCRIIEKPIAT